MERVTVVINDRHSDNVWVVIAEHPEAGRSFSNDWDAARKLDSVPDMYTLGDMVRAVADGFGWVITHVPPVQQVYL